MRPSPKDDFERNTLNSIPGTLGKLEYLAQLREENGRYFHWGLARAHGDDAAAGALRETHLSQFLAVLRAPLTELWNEIRQNAETHQLPVNEYVRELLRLGRALIPPVVDGGSNQHFNSVLLALSELAAQRDASSHQDALLSQPPVR